MIRKILKYILLTAAMVPGLIVAIGTYVYFKTMPTFLDAPSELSGHMDTLEVYYVAWACDCPNWVETKFRKADDDYEIDEKDCIFIEPASKDVQLADSFYADHFGKKVKLVGQFYLDEGIPVTYKMKTPEKPKKARVFRYEKIEVVD